MKIFGYREDDCVSDYPLHLRESTIECTKLELKKVIRFLTYIENDLENYDLSKDEDCHYQYRDWDPSWNEQMPDFIISMISDDKHL